MFVSSQVLSMAASVRWLGASGVRFSQTLKMSTHRSSLSFVSTVSLMAGGGSRVDRRVDLTVATGTLPTRKLSR
jgi:hypothetical protein